MKKKNYYLYLRCYCSASYIAEIEMKLFATGYIMYKPMYDLEKSEEGGSGSKIRFLIISTLQWN